MDAVAEREVLADVAPDIEAVTVGEATIVAIGRANQEHHDAAFRHRLAVVLDIAAHVAGDVGRGWLVAKELLDGIRDQ